MVRLRQDTRGNYVARKRLPDDVREEYGTLFGQSFEAKFYAPASTKRREAERLFHEWLADVDARIANILAQRRGEGTALTRQQARALAGEWYDWFLSRHSSTEKNWEQARDQVQSAMREAIGEKQWEENDPNELWEHDEELREALRPLLADVGETAQFLAAKAVVPNNEARVLFLDFLYKDLAAALKRLIRMSEGDYSPDEYRERFPKSEGADGGESANAAIRAVGKRTRGGGRHRGELAVRLRRNGRTLQGPECRFYYSRGGAKVDHRLDFAITPSAHRQQHVAKREPYGFRMGGKAQAYSEQPIRRRVRHCSEARSSYARRRRSLSKNNE